MGPGQETSEQANIHGSAWNRKTRSRVRKTRSASKGRVARASLSDRVMFHRNRTEGKELSSQEKKRERAKALRPGLVCCVHEQQGDEGREQRHQEKDGGYQPGKDLQDSVSTSVLTPVSCRAARGF